MNLVEIELDPTIRLAAKQVGELIVANRCEDVSTLDTRALVPWLQENAANPGTFARLVNTHVPATCLRDRHPTYCNADLNRLALDVLRLPSTTIGIKVAPMYSTATRPDSEASCRQMWSNIHYLLVVDGAFVCRRVSYDQLRGIAEG